MERDGACPPHAVCVAVARAHGSRRRRVGPRRLPRGGQAGVQGVLGPAAPCRCGGGRGGAPAPAPAQRVPALRGRVDAAAAAAAQSHGGRQAQPPPPRPAPSLHRAPSHAPALSDGCVSCGGRTGVRGAACGRGAAAASDGRAVYRPQHPSPLCRRSASDDGEDYSTRPAVPRGHPAPRARAPRPPCPARDAPPRAQLLCGCVRRRFPCLLRVPRVAGL